MLTAIMAVVGAGASIAGGAIAARGARQAGADAYKQGQIEYHETLNAYMYKRKVAHRQAIEQLHMQAAQWGASGVSVGEGSSAMNMMKSINNMQSDAYEMTRTARGQAWRMWMTGSSQWQAQESRAKGSLLAGYGQAASTLGSAGGSGAFD
jgi:hypothetical protein